MPEPNNSVENRGHVVLAVTTAFLVASTVFVALRLVSRVGVVKKVSTDDYFIVLAWVSSSSRLSSTAGLTSGRALC